jgi:hypothetical protein
VTEEIGSKKYDPEESKDWPKIVTDALLSRLKGRLSNYYKTLFQNKMTLYLWYIILYILV